MKFYIIVILLILPGLISSQPCLPNGITFNYQYEIDEFQTNYPGCTEIESYVSIRGENIRDLSGLNVLESIGGVLHITFCDSLISLNGLNNITTIGGNFNLSFNPRLKDLIGLENLTVIDGYLSIETNDSLQSLDGLESLIAINGRVLIRKNTKLTNIEGISNIDPSSITKLLILENNSLSDCYAQSICDYINNPIGTIDIMNNSLGCNCPSEIASNCGFVIPCLPYGNYHLYHQYQIDSFSSYYPNCFELNGRVRIEGNDIINLNGLNSITSINGSLVVSGTSLSSLQGLEAIDTISEYFDIVLNSNLISVEGLDNLRFIGQDLDFIQNHLLENFEGFNSLTTVGSFLRFWYNSKLKSINGFNNLSSIDGSLWIETHSNLTDLSGFSNIDSIGNQLIFRGNSALKDMAGLGSLSFVENSVNITNNGSLLSLNGLNNLNSINQDLVINNNYSLLDLHALNNLLKIGNYLRIGYNDNLVSLEGINNIEPSSIIDLSISKNPLLSTCEVESVCGYLSSPNGNVGILDNASGCNSRAEVEAACESVGLEDNINNTIFSIYPNPATNKLYVNRKNKLKIESVCIYNQLGQNVLHSNDIKESVDISKLGQGIYIIELTSSGLKIRQKLIIKE